MSRNITEKAIAHLENALNDSRFRPFLFGSAMAEESQEVQEIFHKTILSFISTMARKYELGLSGTNMAIGKDCHNIMGGKEVGFDLNPFDNTI
jgi:hypothetical protein